ncbi:hypothetical protein HYV73_03910 [Candidatus Uhrbacteria bacterium]|nr:hypothetical protein [Candidatus Uhrbacteria bacterium]
METTNTEKKQWLSELVGQVNTLSEEFGLDPASSSKLREFILETARNKYKAGNKSGARWAFSQMKAQPQTA